MRVGEMVQARTLGEIGERPWWTDTGHPAMKQKGDALVRELCITLYRQTPRKAVAPESEWGFQPPDPEAVTFRCGLVRSYRKINNRVQFEFHYIEADCGRLYDWLFHGRRWGSGSAMSCLQQEAERLLQMPVKYPATSLVTFQ